MRSSRRVTFFSRKNGIRRGGRWSQLWFLTLLMTYLTLVLVCSTRGVVVQAMPTIMQYASYGDQILYPDPSEGVIMKECMFVNTTVILNISNAGLTTSMLSLSVTNCKFKSNSSLWLIDARWTKPVLQKVTVTISSNQFVGGSYLMLANISRSVLEKEGGVLEKLGEEGNSIRDITSDGYYVLMGPGEEALKNRGIPLGVRITISKNNFSFIAGGTTSKTSISKKGTSSLSFPLFIDASTTSLPSDGRIGDSLRGASATSFLYVVLSSFTNADDFLMIEENQYNIFIQDYVHEGGEEETRLVLSCIFVNAVGVNNGSFVQIQSNFFQNEIVSSSTNSSLSVISTILQLACNQQDAVVGFEENVQSKTMLVGNIGARKETSLIGGMLLLASSRIHNSSIIKLNNNQFGGEIRAESSTGLMIFDALVFSGSKLRIVSNELFGRVDIPSSVGEVGEVNYILHLSTWTAGIDVAILRIQQESELFITNNSNCRNRQQGNVTYNITGTQEVFAFINFNHGLNITSKSKASIVFNSFVDENYFIGSQIQPQLDTGASLAEAMLTVPREHILNNMKTGGFLRVRGVNWKQRNDNIIIISNQSKLSLSQNIFGLVGRKNFPLRLSYLTMVDSALQVKFNVFRGISQHLSEGQIQGIKMLTVNATGRNEDVSSFSILCSQNKMMLECQQSLVEGRIACINIKSLYFNGSASMNIRENNFSIFTWYGAIEDEKNISKNAPIVYQPIQGIATSQTMELHGSSFFILRNKFHWTTNLSSVDSWPHITNGTDHVTSVFALLWSHFGGSVLCVEEGEIKVGQNELSFVLLFPFNLTEAAAAAVRSGSHQSILPAQLHITAIRLLLEGEFKLQGSQTKFLDYENSFVVYATRGKDYSQEGGGDAIARLSSSSVASKSAAQSLLDSLFRETLVRWFSLVGALQIEDQATFEADDNVFGVTSRLGHNLSHSAFFQPENDVGEADLHFTFNATTFYNFSAGATIRLQNQSKFNIHNISCRAFSNHHDAATETGTNNEKKISKSDDTSFLRFLDISSGLHASNDSQFSVKNVDLKIDGYAGTILVAGVDPFRTTEPWIEINSQSKFFIRGNQIRTSARSAPSYQCSILKNRPDAIRCNGAVLWLRGISSDQDNLTSSSSSALFYFQILRGAFLYLKFSAINGSYLGDPGSSFSDCRDKSIDTLESEGKTFNIVASKTSSKESGVSTSMFPGWADVIKCPPANAFFLVNQDNNQVTYEMISGPSHRYLKFHKNNGTFLSRGNENNTNASEGCAGKSMTQLYNEGLGFNIVRSTEADGTESMWGNFPDAIRCGQYILYWQFKSYEARYKLISSVANDRVVFNNEGQYLARSGTTTTFSCVDKNISTLYKEENAFNFVQRRGGKGNCTKRHLSSEASNTEVVGEADKFPIGYFSLVFLHGKVSIINSSLWRVKNNQQSAFFFRPISMANGLFPFATALTSYADTHLFYSFYTSTVQLQFDSHFDISNNQFEANGIMPASTSTSPIHFSAVIGTKLLTAKNRSRCILQSNNYSLQSGSNLNTTGLYLFVFSTTSLHNQSQVLCINNILNVSTSSSDVEAITSAILQTGALTQTQASTFQTAQNFIKVEGSGIFMGGIRTSSFNLKIQDQNSKYSVLKNNITVSMINSKNDSVLMGLQISATSTGNNAFQNGGNLELVGNNISLYCCKTRPNKDIFLVHRAVNLRFQLENMINKCIMNISGNTLYNFYSWRFDFSSIKIYAASIYLPKRTSDNSVVLFNDNFCSHGMVSFLNVLTNSPMQFYSNSRIELARNHIQQADLGDDGVLSFSKFFMSSTGVWFISPLQLLEHSILVIKQNVFLFVEAENVAKAIVITVPSIKDNSVMAIEENTINCTILDAHCIGVFFWKLAGYQLEMSNGSKLRLNHNVVTLSDKTQDPSVNIYPHIVKTVPNRLYTFLWYPDVQLQNDALLEVYNNTVSLIGSATSDLRNITNGSNLVVFYSHVTISSNSVVDLRENKLNEVIFVKNLQIFYVGYSLRMDANSLFMVRRNTISTLHVLNAYLVIGATKAASTFHSFSARDNSSFQVSENNMTLTQQTTTFVPKDFMTTVFHEFALRNRSSLELRKNIIQNVHCKTWVHLWLGSGFRRQCEIQDSNIIIAEEIIQNVTVSATGKMTRMGLSLIFRNTIPIQQSLQDIASSSLSPFYAPGPYFGIHISGNNASLSRGDDSAQLTFLRFGTLVSTDFINFSSSYTHIDAPAAVPTLNLSENRLQGFSDFVSKWEHLTSNSSSIPFSSDIFYNASHDVNRLNQFLRYGVNVSIGCNFVNNTPLCQREQYKNLSENGRYLLPSDVEQSIQSFQGCSNASSGCKNNNSNASSNDDEEGSILCSHEQRDLITIASGSNNKIFILTQCNFTTINISSATNITIRVLNQSFGHFIFVSGNTTNLSILVHNTTFIAPFGVKISGHYISNHSAVQMSYIEAFNLTFDEVLVSTSRTIPDSSYSEFLDINAQVYFVPQSIVDSNSGGNEKEIMTKNVVKRCPIPMMASSLVVIRNSKFNVTYPVNARNAFSHAFIMLSPQNGYFHLYIYQSSFDFVNVRSFLVSSKYRTLVGLSVIMESNSFIFNANFVHPWSFHLQECLYVHFDNLTMATWTPTGRSAHFVKIQHGDMTVSNSHFFSSVGSDSFISQFLVTSLDNSTLRLTNTNYTVDLLHRALRVRFLNVQGSQNSSIKLHACIVTMQGILPVYQFAIEMSQPVSQMSIELTECEAFLHANTNNQTLARQEKSGPVYLFNVSVGAFVGLLKPGVKFVDSNLTLSHCNASFLSVLSSNHLLLVNDEVEITNSTVILDSVGGTLTPSLNSSFSLLKRQGSAVQAAAVYLQGCKFNNSVLQMTSTSYPLSVNMTLSNEALHWLSITDEDWEAPFFQQSVSLVYLSRTSIEHSQLFLEDTPGHLIFGVPSVKKNTEATSNVAQLTMTRLSMLETNLSEVNIFTSQRSKLQINTITVNFTNLTAIVEGGETAKGVFFLNDILFIGSRVSVQDTTYLPAWSSGTMFEAMGVGQQLFTSQGSPDFHWVLTMWNVPDLKLVEDDLSLFLMSKVTLNYTLFQSSAYFEQLTRLVYFDVATGKEEESHCFLISAPPHCEVPVVRELQFLSPRSVYVNSGNSSYSQSAGSVITFRKVGCEKCKFTLSRFISVVRLTPVKWLEISGPSSSLFSSPRIPFSNCEVFGNISSVITLKMVAVSLIHFSNHVLVSNLSVGIYSLIVRLYLGNLLSELNYLVDEIPEEVGITGITARNSSLQNSTVKVTKVPIIRPRRGQAISHNFMIFDVINNVPVSPETSSLLSLQNIDISFQLEKNSVYANDDEEQWPIIFYPRQRNVYLPWEASDVAIWFGSSLMTFIAPNVHNISILFQNFNVSLHDVLAESSNITHPSIDVVEPSSDLNWQFSVINMAHVYCNSSRAKGQGDRCKDVISIRVLNDSSLTNFSTFLNLPSSISPMGSLVWPCAYWNGQPVDAPPILPGETGLEFPLLAGGKKLPCSRHTSTLTLTMPSLQQRTSTLPQGTKTSTLLIPAIAENNITEVCQAQAVDFKPLPSTQLQQPDILQYHINTGPLSIFFTYADFSNVDILQSWVSVFPDHIPVSNQLRLQLEAHEGEQPNPNGFAAYLPAQETINLTRWNQTTFQVQLPPIPQYHIEADEVVLFYLQSSWFDVKAYDPMATPNVAGCNGTIVTTDPSSLIHAAPAASFSLPSGTLLGAMRIIAPPQPVAKQTKLATEIITQTAVVTGIASSSAVAIDLQSMAILGFMSCTKPFERKMLKNYRILAPTATGDSYVGVVAGNWILFFTLVILQVSAAKIYCCVHEKANWEKAGALFRFPNWSFQALNLTAQGSGFAALQLLFFPRTRNEWILGIAGILYVICIPIVLLFVTLRYVNAEYGNYQWEAMGFRKFVARLLPTGRWEPRRMRRRFGGLFTGLRAESKFFVLFSLSPSAIMIAAASFRPVTTTGCVAQFSSVAAAYFILALILWIYGPLRSHVANISSGIMVSCTGLTAVGSALSSAGKDEAGATMLKYIVPVQLAFAVLRVGYTLIMFRMETRLQGEWKQHHRWRGSAVKSLPSDESTSSEEEAHQGGRPRALQQRLLAEDAHMPREREMVVLNVPEPGGEEEKSHPMPGLGGEDDDKVDGPSSLQTTRQRKFTHDEKNRELFEQVEGMLNKMSTGAEEEKKEKEKKEEEEEKTARPFLDVDLHVVEQQISQNEGGEDDFDKEMQELMMMVDSPPSATSSSMAQGTTAAPLPRQQIADEDAELRMQIL